MGELTAGVDWVATGVGAVLSYMLGGLWYSRKLFGEKWAQGVGMPMGSGSGQPINALVTQFVGTVLLAWLIGITAAAETLLTAILIVVTIAVLLVAGGMFSNKSNYALAAEGGFVITMAIIMIICQGVL